MTVLARRRPMENRPKLEPRILVEDSTKSYHARHRVYLSRGGAEAQRMNEENNSAISGTPRGRNGSLRELCASA